MLLVAARPVRRLPAVRAAHGRWWLIGAVAEATVVLQNPSGLHARLAAAVVRAARGLDAAVTVTNLDRDAGRSATAASIVGLLTLGGRPGDRLLVRAEGGEGAAEAVAAVSAALRAPQPATADR